MDNSSVSFRKKTKDKAKEATRPLHLKNVLLEKDIISPKTLERGEDKNSSPAS